VKSTYYKEVETFFRKNDFVKESNVIAWASTIAGNSNDDENALYTVNKLVKFDAECFEPIETGGKYYTTSQAENVGQNFWYKMWFVTKKDGTNWKDEKERNNAKIEDLILYDNYQDIPSNYLCVGEYFETQGGYLVTGYQIIDVKLKIKDTAKIGETYGVMHNTLAWTESLDRSIYTATNKEAQWPKPVYDTSSINYLKTNYDENFNIIKGTHNGGNVYGQTILVVGADLSISKKAIINENEEKINYMLRLVKSFSKSHLSLVRGNLKDYIKRITGWNGEETNKPRELLQQMGISLIKYKIDDKLLINRLLQDIEVFSYFYDIIIITDARLKEEIEIPKNKFNNIITIRINRNNTDNNLTQEQKNHITEIDLDNYNDFDYIIDNNDYKTLETEIINILKENRYE